ncbi:ATPase family AAA domain-containing protein 5b isoform X2 [Betta splendens]|uniref:ATPase family AAA domain-containing protein 5b isoform X2 n=1 Tax=Betta splendens TaxID=158456 RepID=A0A6P7NHU9_BETSP|nr:ATPase family AAA domain-containing protein 5b isoform X2 [Betta splendens]
MSAGRFPRCSPLKCDTNVHGTQEPRTRRARGGEPTGGQRRARARASCLSAGTDEPPRRTGDVQIAPIFCAALRREIKGIGEGATGQHVEKTRKPAAGASPTDGGLRVKGQRMSPALTDRREQMSGSALNICLERIHTCNATSPLQTAFSTLQTRAGAGPQRSHSTGKRRRSDESSETASKRLRCGFTGASKLSRTRRLKRRGGGSAGPPGHREPPGAAERSSGSGCEEVLWTDKYGPQHPGDVIGNAVPVNTLHSWLKKWKLRADTEERKTSDGRKLEDNTNDSWDCGDFQGEAGPDGAGGSSLGSAVLLTGPPGVGKTAAVYACALELGFQVFEVNCSSQRSGRQVLSQLREATQSHLVETSGKDPLKPASFRVYTGTSCSAKSEASPANGAVRPKNVLRTTKRGAELSGGRRGGKATPAARALAHYFKMKARADGLRFGGLSSAQKPDTSEPSDPPGDRDHTVPRSKRTTASLILFEEVDVVFEDDVGFYAAIRTFMTTTKRPVVLTTTDPLFRERFGCNLDEITFETPSALVGSAERVRLQADDVGGLLALTRGDVRRCLLQLQLWVRGGGGRAPLGGRSREEAAVCAQYAGSLDPRVPSCETGCTSSMLGLGPVTQTQLLNYLKSRYWSEADMKELLMLLAESWRQRVPLLYSNLELLLPIGACGASVHYLNRAASPELQSANVTSKPTDGNHVRKISRLSRRKHNTCATTSSCGVNRGSSASLPKAPTSSDNVGHKAAKLETDILVAVADFFDVMSYLDATLPAPAPLVSGFRPEGFVWTGAELKDGLWDDRGDEEGGGWGQENLLHIQAAVEGLGCHRCCWLLSEAWTAAQKHRQTMEDKLWETLERPAASETQSLRFGVQPLCSPSVSQKRYELSRAVFGSEPFSLLGNRRAVSVDYMPILRSICRFQKAQQQNEKPVRYINYMSGTGLGLSKSTMKLLAEDFP